MLDDVDESNGEIRVIPASHLWDHALEDHDPANVHMVGAVARAGTAMAVEGRTYHQAEANRSDAQRRVLLSNYFRAWVRQPVTPFTGLAPDIEANLTPDLKRLLGFKTWGSLGGLSEHRGIDPEGYVSRPEHVTTKLAAAGTPLRPRDLDDQASGPYYSVCRLITFRIRGTDDAMGVARAHTETRTRARVRRCPGARRRRRRLRGR